VPRDPTTAGSAGAGEDLARRLSELSPEARAELREALRHRSTPTGIARRSAGGPAPLSFSQQRMWFLDQWEPASPTANGARAVRLRGDLDLQALRRALAAIVDRHEILRTVYVVEAREPRQVPLDTWSIALPVTDLVSEPPERREAALTRLLREEARQGFDLARDVMVRARLFRLGAAEHVLLLTMHHIASDAASDRVFNRELAELYGAFAAGRAPELAELPFQYADYAVWQRERLQGPLLEQLVAYWRAALADAPPRLQLPTDRVRGPVQRHNGVHRYVSYRELGDGVADLARREGTTVYITLLAAFDALLYRFTGQDDIVVGSPVAARNEPGMDALIGFFTNTLVLRNRLVGNPTFRELLTRVRTTTVGALAHQELPFEKLVETLNVPRDPSFNPLFQVNFRAQAEPRELLRLPGLATMGPIPIDIGFSRFDLALELHVDGSGLAGYFEYDEELFDPATIDALAADFEELLRSAVAAPATPILALIAPRRPRVAHGGRIPRTSH
jgi:hypothetical protein